MTGTATAENTTAPTGPAAPAPAAKSKPQTVREFERSMRALGYSQREAAAIASHGFKAIGTVEQAVDQAEISELAALIAKTISILKVSS
jgi:predicted ATP-grasp superfamily ATP-dependent carboligase